MSEERYHITRLIGKGRTGGVYEAEDSVLSRKVALRRFFTQQGSVHLDEYGEQFTVIAQNLGALHHPNLQTVFDAGVDEDGGYIVSQLLEGVSIPDFLKENKTIPSHEAANLASQLLEALLLAHSEGFIHGALTPDSVLMQPRARGGYRYIILDMGLSRLAPLIQGENSALAMMADPALLAPELFDGSPATEQADIYMVGQLVYYVLAGGHPFAGFNMEQAHEAHQKGVPSIETIRSDVDPRLTTWIQNLTHPDPTLRPATATEALQILPSIQATQPVITSGQISQPLASQPSLQVGLSSASTQKNYPAWLIPSIAISSIITLGLFLFLLFGKEKKRADPTNSITYSEAQPLTISKPSTPPSPSPPNKKTTTEQEKPATKQTIVTPDSKNPLTLPESTLTSAPKPIHGIWKFHQNNIEGNQLDTTFLGSPKFASTPKFNDEGFLIFDGEQFTSLPNSTVSRLRPEEFSIEIIFKINPNSTGARPILSATSNSHKPADRGGFSVMLQGNWLTLRTFGKNAPTKDATSLSMQKAPRNTWCHLIVTQKAGEISFFCNGKYYGSAELHDRVYAPPKEDTRVRIGEARTQVHSHFLGSIRRIRFFDSGLTHEEVSFIMQQFKTPTSPKN